MIHKPDHPQGPVSKAVLVTFIVLLLLALYLGTTYSIHLHLRAVTQTVSDMSSHIQNLEGKMDVLQDDLNNPHGVYEFHNDWMEASGGIVAHAMGGIDHYTYTNSLEAFQESYRRGCRVFEVDFSMTASEYFLIATHNESVWRKQTDLPPESPFSLDTFKSTPLYNTYTALDYRDIIQLLRDYPDIWIITDIQYTDYANVHLAFTQLTRYAESVDSSVLDRIVPQIYHEQMLPWVMNIYPFKSVIYTLLENTWTPESVYTFCARSGIRCVAMHQEHVREDVLAMWIPLGITVASFTCNDAAEAQRGMDQGVDLIFSDFLSPHSL